MAPSDEKLRFGIAQDVRLPRGIFGDAVGAKRRIDRDGNAAREQNARERGEKLGARGQHDRDGLTGFEAAATQFVRDG